MLAIHNLRQTSRHLILNASRSTFSTLPNKTSIEKQPGTDATTHNYPSFYDTSNVDNLKKLTDNIDTVASNDLLEAKRISKEKKDDKTPVTTSTEKFASGLSPLPSTSSIAPTGSGLFQDVKTSNTPVSPGIPIQTSTPPIVEEEHEKKENQLPSSGFSAFLRGISSGLPFFPSNKMSSSPVNIGSTREYFLPLTRPSLIRLIATDSEIIDDAENRLVFHQICHGFDSAVVQCYYPVLNELKNLFNPLNPDNETLDNRRVSYRDRLDNEYWLLQKINDLLYRANFTELPRNILLDKFILHQDSVLSSNLNIKIDGHDYDVLKFWVMGRERMPLEGKSWWKKLFQKKNQITSRDYFKRVILAARLKGQDRLYLKAFRDIPLQNLTQLLPVGKIQMGNFEQQLLRTSVLLGTGTAITHLITTMANYHIPGLVIGGSSLTLLLSLWSMRSYYNSKINYLSSTNRSLFYKNIASSKQLLAMIVDRAEDELSKEVLLVYMFILWKQQQKGDLTKKNLEIAIENWIQSKTNTDVTFNSDQSIEFLRKIGILLPHDSARPNHLEVLPFKQVISILPKTSRTLSEKNEEWDLVEGYDKKYFEVDWKTILNEDKLLNKNGWH
ncbi:unnamed protein product [Adineta steineri]|uniref:Uncharacterized protein n=3 Tax=Adineta steineri TaxID=433720 RepID=A0A818N3R1_9BILA|nr:unnamed protein product [Adineta steineri]CAF3599197.1 unnamed protein product [Adineta steineri]